MALYKERVLPVLNDWGSEIEYYQPGTDSHASAQLTRLMKLNVAIDSGSEDATVLTPLIACTLSSRVNTFRFCFVDPDAIFIYS
jgi:hypothetical protein